ncbi:MAG: DNA-binding NarL/FixJ family response regulator [Oceanicoccus sp.]|jgi:DNA-binding NarL/FixJ family response regulator
MKIVIADDHAMTRSGVVAALSEMFPAARIVECCDASSVLVALKQEKLNLAIVDLFMPGSDGFGFLKKLCKTYPELPVIVLSASDNPKHVRNAIDIGVSGFIHKSSGFERMHEAINKVLAGGSYWPDFLRHEKNENSSRVSDIESPEMRDALIDSLTRRQLDILVCLAQGLSNKTIAGNLFISENTVKTHLKAIMSALGCSNRTEAGVLAEKLGLASS